MNKKMPSAARAAKIVMSRCDELGLVSEEPGRLTRTFHSVAMQQANALVGVWMKSAGLEVREDAAFNLIGRWPCANSRAKTLLLGSHLDTVRDAGKYDGPLGVVLALAAVEILREAKVTLPFHVEIVGFSDEEGTRYQTTYLGSRAMAGTLSKKDLALIQEKGIERARRKASEFLAYAEVHIEQGPVLEAKNLAVGLVTAIASQSRVRLSFTGTAGHAGTTPMKLRRDALCGAAEFIGAVEKCGITATVGQVDIRPGASNVIPGAVHLSLDIRDQSDARRSAVCDKLRQKAMAIGSRRNLEVDWDIFQETLAVPCDLSLGKIMRQAISKHQQGVPSLPSGAGHDGAEISRLCPFTMLFVRCKGGISHNPAESVRPSDVATAIAVLCDFIQLLASGQH